MKVMYKYPIAMVGTTQVVNVPWGGIFRHFDIDAAGDLCAWFEVDKGQDAVPRTLRIFATGQDIPDGWYWLGTTLVLRGQLVWHLCELLA